MQDVFGRAVYDGVSGIGATLVAGNNIGVLTKDCLLYTSDAADE